MSNHLLSSVFTVAFLTSVLTPKASLALVFDFSWSSNTFSPASVNTPLQTGQEITAVGTLDINKNPGENFSGSDISNVNITVSDGLGSSFLIDTPFSGTATGSISLDSSTASFGSGAAPFSFGSSPTSDFFGCDFGTGCPSSGYNIRVRFDNTNYDFNYNSPEQALASFQMTNSVPVPFESSPTLGILVLGGVFGISRLRKKLAATKKSI